MVNSFGAGYNGAEYDDFIRRGVTGRATVNQFNPRLNMNLGFFGNKNNGAGNLVNNLDDLITKPKQLQNATPNEWYKYLKDNGYNPQPLSGGSLKGMPFDQGGGFKVNWGGYRILQYHPAGGHHGGVEYWKISSGTTGTIRYDMFGNIIP